MNLLTLFTAFAFTFSQPDWRLYSSGQQVDVYFTEQDCHDEVNGLHRTYVLLKMVNKTDARLEVSWLTERYEGGRCTTCGKDEYRQKLVLEPGAEVSSSCSDLIKPLSLFKKHLDLQNYSVLERFELADFQVKEL